MLSRDADSMYWMSRYVERAEHVARMLLVNASLLTDVGDIEPTLQVKLWNSILEVMRVPPMESDGQPLARRIQRFMVFDRENPSSLISSISLARENGRSIRESISAEMWESLNRLYWSINSDEAESVFEDSPDDFYRRMLNGSMLFQGLTDQTLPHDQRWLFARLAKFLERADVTARILQMRAELLSNVELETPICNIMWMAVLRSVCSIEAYRRNFTGDMDPMRVASFVILERVFPRSIRFAVEQAHEAITMLRSQANPNAIDPAERVLGRLNAQLEFAEMGEVLAAGMTPYLVNIQLSIGEAALAIQKAYFLH